MDLREELDRDLKINPGQLDVEAVRQAELFYRWAERAAEAKANADRADFEYDTVCARVQMEIRLDPKRYGLEKATEAAIEALCQAQKVVAESHERRVSARKDAALAANAASAMEQRKRMLEVLITLHGQQYFAGPSVPRDLVSAYQEYQTNAQAAVTERQREGARKRVRKEA